MVQTNHGHIVTISSAAGRIACQRLADYSASKAAAVSLHHTVTKELRTHGKDGVKMTNICPFFIKTGMFEGVRSNPL